LLPSQQTFLPELRIEEGIVEEKTFKGKFDGSITPTYVPQTLMIKKFEELYKIDCCV